MTGTLVAVCVVHEPIPDPGGSVGVTSIDKRPVAAPMHLGPLGLVDDHQQDRVHHGGPDQAVYAYADEDRQWWAESLGRELAPGVFGENLVTLGIDVTGAVIGETWQLGATVLQVTGPRIPCVTFQRWLNEGQWVKRFTEAGRPGAYLRVLEPGDVTAGDAVTVLHRPDHGVTVGEVFAGRFGDPDRLRLLLAEGRDLQPSVVERIERELAVGQ